MQYRSDRDRRDAIVENIIRLVDKVALTEDKIALNSITSKQNHMGSSCHASITSDVKSESVGSKTRCPSESKSDRSWLVKQRQPYVANPETTSNIEISTQRVRASVFSHLEGFSGKGRDEDWARSWIDKVRSAFAREQIPDEDKMFRVR